MIADTAVSWDVAGIVASVATLVTAMAGAVILTRKNSAQHGNNLGEVREVAAQVKKIAHSVSENGLHVRKLGVELGALRHDVAVGSSKGRADREALFSMLAELDQKVSVLADSRVSVG